MLHAGKWLDVAWDATAAADMIVQVAHMMSAKLFYYRGFHFEKFVFCMRKLGERSRILSYGTIVFEEQHQTYS